MYKYLTLIILCVVIFASVLPASSKEQPNDKLVVLWTSGDRDVALKVCLMYTHAAKNNGWFDQVRLVVWGPSSKLLSTDLELQQKIKTMQESGIEVLACIVCANQYGVTDDLRNLGIEVKAMGAPLTDMLKSDWKQLTF
jgi:hypothetical protein